MNIGDTLRAAREKAGLSIEDVKNVSHMTTYQVQCLDSGDLSDKQVFTAPVYTKGFIRLYANAVGIDPAPIIAAYMASLGDEAKPRTPAVALEVAAPDGGPFRTLEPKNEAAQPAEKAPSFEKRVAPAPEPVLPKRPAEPMPEKRVAAAEPGMPPPPPPPDKPERHEIVREFDFSPVDKQTPEPESPAFRLDGAIAPVKSLVAPEPEPLSMPPFVFPGAELASTESSMFASAATVNVSGTPAQSPAPAPAPVQAAAQPAAKEPEDDLFSVPVQQPETKDEPVSPKTLLPSFLSGAKPRIRFSKRGKITLAALACIIIGAVLLICLPSGGDDSQGYDDSEPLETETVAEPAPAAPKPVAKPAPAPAPTAPKSQVLRLQPIRSFAE